MANCDFLEYRAAFADRLLCSGKCRGTGQRTGQQTNAHCGVHARNQQGNQRTDACAGSDNHCTQQNIGLSVLFQILKEGRTCNQTDGGHKQDQTETLDKLEVEVDSVLRLNISNPGSDAVLAERHALEMSHNQRNQENRSGSQRNALNVDLAQQIAYNDDRKDKEQHHDDQKLRILTDYGHPLKETELPKYIQQALDKALAEFLEERRRAAAPKPKPIQFDLSRLQNIRQAADTTRDKLLVDEDVTQEPEPPVIAAPTPAPESEHTPAQDSRLSETETAFLRCLLDGTPYADLLRQRNVMLSVLVDHINETLFDDFGDTVILFDGDTPELIEDYAEDVAALLETSV